MGGLQEEDRSVSTSDGEGMWLVPSGTVRAVDAVLENLLDGR